MTNHLISEQIKIKDNSAELDFNFHCYSDNDVVFGTFDCFDQHKKPLDFRKKDLYLLLRKHFPGLSFASLQQIHSAKLHIIGEPEEISFQNHGEGDGLLTKATNLALSIRTADCLPLFLWSHEFTALLHIGYRGLLNGILDSFTEGLHNFSEHLKINAAIGSHIRECCFEVQEDILQLFHNFHLFTKHDIMTQAERTFICLRSMIRRWYEKNHFQGRFYDLSICSCCHEEMHSWRRNKTAFRMGHIIFRRSIA